MTIPQSTYHRSQIDRHVLRRLFSGRVTVARVLAESVLLEVQKSLPRRAVPDLALVAGGGRRIDGSETTLLQGRHEDSQVLYIDRTAQVGPDVIADLENAWPVASESVGIVVSTWVLEHVATPNSFFREAFRVLQNGSIFVCAVPFIYRKHAAPRDYFRFTDFALRHLSMQAGFSSAEVLSVGGGPMTSALSLVWPLLRLPLVGLGLYLGASLLDHAMRKTSQALGRGVELVNAYPIHFIVISSKGGVKADIPHHV